MTPLWDHWEAATAVLPLALGLQLHGSDCARDVSLDHSAGLCLVPLCGSLAAPGTQVTPARPVWHMAQHQHCQPGSSSFMSWAWESSPIHGMAVLHGWPGLPHTHTVAPCLCPLSVSLALLMGRWDTALWGFRALSLQGPEALG